MSRYFGFALVLTAFGTLVLGLILYHSRQETENDNIGPQSVSLDRLTEPSDSISNESHETSCTTLSVKCTQNLEAKNRKELESSIDLEPNTARVVAPDLTPAWTKRATQLQRIELPTPREDHDRKMARDYVSFIVLGSDQLKIRHERKYIKVVLQNVRGIPFRQKCKKKDGTTWACGGWARNRLSSKLTDKIIACKIEVEGEPTGKEVYPAKCWLDQTDLADIIILEGIGEPVNADYGYHVYLSEQAKRYRRGLWRDYDHPHKPE